MSAVLPLAVVPVVLPLLSAAALLLATDAQRRLGSLLNILATLAGLLVAVALLLRVDDGGSAAIAVHLTSNWAAPYGIPLVADRLSALMLVVVGVVALGAALYASAGWYRVGTYFYPLFQILLMGVNGAFLTGDLFNLFVFFEVMLAATYGLRLYQRTMTGPLPDEVAPHFTHDLDAREKSVLIPVIAVILLFGFMPGPIMQLAEPTAKAAMQRMQLDDPVAPAKGEK